MLANSFNLENFKRHFQQTIPKPSGMSDETENVDKLRTLYAFFALYSILWRHNDGWVAKQQLACEQALHLGEGNEPRENARAGVPSLSCFLSRAARACTWRDPQKWRACSQAWQETDKPNDPAWVALAGLKENSSTKSEKTVSIHVIMDWNSD